MAELLHDSQGNFSVKEYCDTDDPKIVEDVQQDFKIRANAITAAGELIYKRDHLHIQEDLVRGTVRIPWPSMYNINQGLRNLDGCGELFYKMVYGDKDSAALFVLEGRSSLIDLAHPAEHDTPKIIHTL